MPDRRAGRVWEVPPWTGDDGRGASGLYVLGKYHMSGTLQHAGALAGADDGNAHNWEADSDTHGERGGRQQWVSYTTDGSCSCSYELVSCTAAVISPRAFPGNV